MKLKNLLISSAIALGLVASAGVALSLHNEANNVSADAGHPVAYDNSGKIYLQLNTNEWKSNGSKIGLYMFNNSVSKSAWGSLVTPSGSSRFVEYSYNLDFTPTGCIAFRFDPGVETMGDWCWENDRGNSAIWSTTNDIDFNSVVWLGDYYPASKWTNSGSYGLTAVVMGGATESWSDPTVDAQLTNVKVNRSDNLEVFGEVSLPANTHFKVVKAGSSWSGSYTANPLIESNLSVDGQGNIVNAAAATYDFYYDYDGETMYITDPVLAEADEWAQYFLANVGCDETSKTLPSGWATVSAEYAKLSNGAKDLVYGAEAKEDGTYVEQAVARYDVAVSRHSELTKFIVNSSSAPRASHFVGNSFAGYEVESSRTLTIVVIATVIAATSLIGVTLIIKKRKAQ